MGVILGTASYMSPEQAKGRAADKRSDVWAFGCVLYEMLTGRRTFEGEEVSETLASVLKSDPDWTALPRETPAAIRALLEGSLKRDRRDRIGDISTARFLLTQPAARRCLRLPHRRPVRRSGSARRSWRSASRSVRPRSPASGGRSTRPPLRSRDLPSRCPRGRGSTRFAKASRSLPTARASCISPTAGCTCACCRSSNPGRFREPNRRAMPCSPRIRDRSRSGPTRCSSASTSAAACPCRSIGPVPRRPACPGTKPGSCSRRSVPVSCASRRTGEGSRSSSSR